MSMIKYLSVGMHGIDVKPKYPFTGSAIRGVFGRSLRRVVCPYLNASCDECYCFDGCIYAEFFENVSKTPKFILDIDLNSYSFDFKIFLFENSIFYAPHVVIALKDMCQFGIGMPRRRFDFQYLTINGRRLEDLRSINLCECFLVFSPSLVSRNYKITTLTPIRIKQKDDYVYSEVDFKLFIRQIAMRLGDLTNVKIDKFEIRFDKFEQNLKFYNLERYSNRQRKKMKFGGLMGEMIVYGIDINSARLLEVATLIHVGKSASFGLGKIRIEKI